MFDYDEYPVRTHFHMFVLSSKMGNTCRVAAAWVYTRAANGK